MKEMNNKDIIVVAGPSASGKSHLLKKLLSKKNKNKFRDEIYYELIIDPKKPRSCIAIGALSKQNIKHEHFCKLRKDLIFIHFDITSRNQNNKRHLLLSIAKSCKSIKILTLKTPFDIWHQRMRQRIDINQTKSPTNIADAIYRLSRLSRYLAKWRYESTYKKWEQLIKNIDHDGELIVKNDEMSFKLSKTKNTD